MRSATPRTCRAVAAPSRERPPPARRWRGKPDRAFLAAVSKNPLLRQYVSLYAEVSQFFLQLLGRVDNLAVKREDLSLQFLAWLFGIPAFGEVNT